MGLQTGAVIEASVFGPVESTHLAAYADASGDHNAIHLDEQAAKRVGLPGIIAHGMLSAALLADRAVTYVNGYGKWRLLTFQTRFKGMVLLGDTVSSAGQVKSCANGLLTLVLQAKNQRGEIVTTATAEFREEA